MSDLSSKVVITNIKTSYKWVIDNFRALKLPVGKCLRSPTFNSSGTCDSTLPQWYLTIYPQGTFTDVREYISLYLNLQNKTIVQASCQLSILNSLYEKTYESDLGLRLYSFDAQSEKGWGIKNVVRRSILLDNQYRLLHNGKLIILCEIEIKNDQPIINCKLNGLLNRFENLLNNEKFSDVKFIVNGKEVIYAHKNILANENVVFAALFEHDMKENRENTIEISDISYEVLKEMLRYIYCGKVNEMHKYSKELLYAADKYAIDELKASCERYLCNDISIDNAIELLQLSDMYNAKELREKAIKFIAMNDKHLLTSGKLALVANLDPVIVTEVMKALVLK